MSRAGRRRRAFLMLSLSLAHGGLAASEVGGRLQQVEQMVGRPLPVVVAARDVAAKTSLRRADLELRRVPARYVSPGALSAPGDAAGARTAVPLAAGAPVTEPQLEGAARGGAGSGPRALRRGERAVEVAVAGGAALAAATPPDVRVDVLVSTEPRAAPGRSVLALQDVELLGLRPGEAEPAGTRHGGAAAGTLATLRVTLRQAVYLTAAQNFARELRLLPRPPGDSRRAKTTVVGAGAL